MKVIFSFFSSSAVKYNKLLYSFYCHLKYALCGCIMWGENEQKYSKNKYLIRQSGAINVIETSLVLAEPCDFTT